MRSGVVDVSFSASFLKNSAPSAYTTSAVWMSSYVMPGERFKGIPALTSVGTAVKANDERWAQNLRQRICRGGYKRRTFTLLDKSKI